VENPVYHVLLQGRRVGPYDRRTILGMRVKKTLSSKERLLGPDGSELTVGELVRQGQPETGFAASAGGPPSGHGSHSVVRGIHAAKLLEVGAKGYAIPPFQGEIELRVQTSVLRLSGRFRQGSEWKEERVKFPLPDIAHARLRGTVVDLWVRIAEAPGTQRISLDLLTAEAAGELAESLPHTAPWPGSEPLAGAVKGSGMHPLTWAAVGGTAVIVVGVLAWVLTRGV
jgi:hypothetical protein